MVRDAFVEKVFGVGERVSRDPTMREGSRRGGGETFKVCTVCPQLFPLLNCSPYSTVCLSQLTEEKPSSSCVVRQQRQPDDTTSESDKDQFYGDLLQRAVLAGMCRFLSSTVCLSQLFACLNYCLPFSTTVCLSQLSACLN